MVIWLEACLSFDELDEEHEITRAPCGGHTHVEIDLPALLPLAQQSLHYPWAAYSASHTPSSHTPTALMLVLA